MSDSASHQQSIPASAAPDEAAAIVAAIEVFVAETTPPAREQRSAHHDAWREAALLEGVARDPWEATGDSWLGSLA